MKNDARYNNYHKHDHYSNIRTPDVIVKPEDYMRRAVELGHTTYFTTNHGCSSNPLEAYDLCKKYNLKMIYGMEMYYSDDRFIKEGRNNSHIIVIGLTKNAYYHINRISSEANKTGFYYHPRVDIELLLSLPPKEVVITTACISGRLFKTEDYIDVFVNPLKSHFGDNFMLEVQDHEHEYQESWNKKVLELSSLLDIPIIHGCDSHYIYKEDVDMRTKFLKGKGMDYGSEDEFILDYPERASIVNNYKRQGILTDEQVDIALNNTLVFDKAEDLAFNKEIKMPTIYPNQDKNKVLRKIIADKWNIEKKTIDVSLHDKYKEEIYSEVDIIEKTNMADYFLLNEKIIDKAVNEYGGVLTRTGRGCFTKDSLVHTEKTMKSIKDVMIGDKVITESGKFNKVINTMEYDVEEDMIQIKHIYGTDKYYPTICTLDHKILINREGTVDWMQAKDIIKGDYVCVPKINLENKVNGWLDLNDYNDFGYEFDNEYIYEMSPYFNNYIKYCPKEVAKEIGVGRTLFERFANGENVPFTRKPWALEKFFEIYPFNNQQEYVEYMRKNRTRKINRFIKIDGELNTFIGLMYGDGFAPKNRPYTIGLATHSSEDVENKDIFCNIAKRIGIEVVFNESKDRKLTQLFINSNIMSSFIRRELFISEKGKDKEFNNKWFYQNKENLLGLIEGLRLSDGSFKERRISFDNTSASIINAYKLLCLMTGEGVNSMSIRPSWIMKGDYKCKESYKLRINPNSNNNIKATERTKEDEFYWYLPVKETIVLPNQKTKVYDIEVENEHSYLLNNMIVHNSAPSYFVNKLLGFTDIDRISAKVPLYSTRFMTVSRILETGSLPDIDFNFAEIEPAIRASKDILGEDGIYFMVAFGTMQDSAAFRNLCRAYKFDMEKEKQLDGNGKVIDNEFNKKLDLKIGEFNKDTNNVAKNLDLYRNDKKWKGLIEESKSFIGVIDSIAPSPCSFLLLNEPISKEVGLIRVGDEICAFIDGYTADKWKYLKNDLLTVGVWDIISKTFELIDRPIPTIKELDDLLEDDVWDLYANGITSTLNQADSDFATNLVKKYRPTSIAEMSAFVAAIRPGFASLLNHFINREEYTTHVPALDEVLEDSFHYMLYQESIMKMLIWCGIEEDQTYDIIKKIAKKVFDEQELAEFKLKLMEGFKKQTGSTEWFSDVWQVVEDAVEYSFNASHSLSVSYDSLYGAYLKAKHPLEYYKVVLDHYKDDKNRTTRLIGELSYFDITLNGIKFRYSTAGHTIDKENKAIYKGIASIKYISENLADELYELRNNKYETFVDLLIDIKEKTSCNTRQLSILIKLDFFSEFGKAKKLLDIVELHDYIGKNRISIVKAEESPFTLEQFEKYSARKTAKTFMEVDFNSMVRDMAKNIPDEDLSIKEKAEAQLENLGYIDLKLGVDGQNCYITAVNTKFTPRVSAVSLNDGRNLEFKIKKDYFSLLKLNVGDLIYVHNVENRQSWRVNGHQKNGKPKFEKIEGRFDLYISNCEKISEEQLYIDRSDGDTE